jgi:hypothetical protein
VILSVLDQSPIPEGSTAAEALHNTLDLAASGLEAVASEYGADEVVVLTITHSHGARRRSYELIASEFGLEAAAQPPPSSSVATER